MKSAGRLFWMPCVLLVMAQGASGQSEQQKTSRIWKSADGKVAVKVDETINSHHADGGRGIIRTQESQVIGLSVAADGSTTELWRWTEKPPGGSGYIPLEIADVLIADSHKRIVLVGLTTGLPPTAYQRVITFLDDTGQAHVSVTGDKWWKALGAEGKITDKAPKLHLRDDEKTLEMTFESGTTVHVDTDSAEITVIKRAATAPASMPAVTAPSQLPKL